MSRRRAVAHPTVITPRPTIPTQPTQPTVPRPQRTHRTVRTVKEIQMSESAVDQPRDILFGRTTQGMKLLYANSFGNGTVLYLVGGIGEGPIRSITPRVDETAMTLQTGTAINPNGSKYVHGSISAWVYDGSQPAGTQETASGLRGNDPNFSTTTAAWTNLAYVIIRMDYNQNLSAIPKFTFDVEGYRDLYDPRNATRGYSENTALVIREVMTNTRWGMAVPASVIDDTAFGEAATDCDTALFPTNPTAAPTVAIGAAGVIPNGTYYYTYTNVHANGVESLESPLSAAIVANNQQVTVTLPASPATTAQRYVYRSAAGDSTTRRRVGTLAGSAAGPYTDNAAAATWNLGVPAPKAAPLVTARYQIGINMSKQTTAEDWLETLRAHCLGVFITEGGKYQLRINKKLPAGYTPQLFTEWTSGTTKPNVEPGSIRWGRKKRSEVFNEVEVKYTDAQNKFSPGSIIKKRPGVEAGTEQPRRATYHLPGLIDSAIAGRVATNLLNLAWDDVWFEWTADRSALKTLPWDVVQLNGGGVNNQLVRVRAVVSKGEGFTIRGTEYQELSYSDTIVAGDAPVLAGTFGLTAAGSLAPPTSLSITEQVDQPQPGIFLPKLIVNFVANTGPQYGGTKLTVQVAGGSETVAGTFYAGPVTIPVPEGAGKSVTVRGYTVDLRSGVSGTTPLAQTFTMYNPALPEPPGWITITNDNKAYWDVPVRTATVYPATSWTSSGTTIFTPSALNDGNAATAGAQFNAATAGWLRLDAGAAQALREFELTFIESTSQPPFAIQWSDDDANFNTVGYTDLSKTQVNPLKLIYSVSPAVGSHRYWRLWKDDSWAAYTARISEIRSIRYTGSAFPYVKGFRLSGYVPGGGGERYFKDINYLPTATLNPIDTADFNYSWEEFDPVYQMAMSGGSHTELSVQTISPTNAMTEPRTYKKMLAWSAMAANLEAPPQPWLGLGSVDFAPAAGANSNIAAVRPGDKNLVRLTGTNVGWTIGGFQGGHSGRVFTLLNSTSTEGTIVHEEAASTATNRFMLPDNVNATIAPGASITFVYDEAAGSAPAGRWRRADNPSSAIERIRKLSASYGSLDVKGVTNGYSGIHFADVQRILMMHGTYQGVYNSAASAWQWYFANGVLTAGTVPYTQVTGKPDLAVNDGSYGSFKANGQTNGWPGIYFSSAGTGGYFLWNGTQQGAYDTATGWKWRFNNGTLDIGTIPGSQVSAPRTAWQNNSPVTAQELAWKNYGNAHTIVDNSAGSYRPSNVDPDVEWSPTYPTLMGFNGTNTYGVRVDRARWADHLRPGATVATPAATDNSTTVATTAWVRANGGGMERVATMTPTIHTSSMADGMTSMQNRPRGFLTARGSSYLTTATTVLNITGKGVLRFLSAGTYNYNYSGYLTLVIDGTNVLTDAVVGWSSTYGESGYNTVFVGSLVYAFEPTNGEHIVSAVPSDYGITFKTSLTIYTRASSQGYVYSNFAYLLY